MSLRGLFQGRTRSQRSQRAMTARSSSMRNSRISIVCRRCTHGAAYTQPDHAFKRLPAPADCDEIRFQRPSDSVTQCRRGHLMLTEAEAVFTPRGAESWRDPFSMYRALRDHDPVHHVADNGEGEDYWVLSRYRHVFDAAVDAETFSSADGLTIAYGEKERIGIEAPIVMTDPPRHTALRKVVIGPFTHQRVQVLEPVVRAFVVEGIERMRARGE